MTSRSRKRKHVSQPPHGEIRKASTRKEPDPALFIQAHEADIIRGPQARAAAKSLEVTIVNRAGRRDVRPGDGLIRWGHMPLALDADADLEGEAGGDGDGAARVPVEDGGIWVDRYDARLLLDAMPSKATDPRQAGAETPHSPAGWSDLPSDTEDTFFFSPEEAADYHREKRRRTMERDREARLKARRLEDGDDADGDGATLHEEVWGGSDEEPDDTVRDLMRRTAVHILSSPNPAQLEMRILANHGADRRFAFLRGRWARAWAVAKGRVRMERERERAETVEASGSAALGGLAGYGDSDEDGGDETENEDGGGGDNPRDDDGMQDATVLHDNDKDNDASLDGGAGQDDPSPREEEQGVNIADSRDLLDDDMKKARRARAKAWAEKRRALRTDDDV